MRVAFVVPQGPAGTHNFHQIPIGTLYAAAQLRRRGDAVSVHDLRFGEPDDTVYGEIGGADLAVVCSTDYDLAQCYPSLAPTARCVRSINDAGAATVVCVGSHGTADAALTRAFSGADVVVAGEFEFAVPDLVAALESGVPVPERWPAEGVRLATEAELAELDAPAYDLVPMDRYHSEGFTGDELDRVNSGLLLGNRGCPYACDFCYLFFGRRMRRRPVEKTLDELQSMYRRDGIRHFFFLDYTFTLDQAWVRSLCAGIRRRKLPISWVCQTRVDCLDDATLAEMRMAGCAGVWLGIESPELDQRRYLSKGRIAFDDIQRGVARIRAAGMQVLSFVMVGLPNETESSLRNLNRWLEESHVYYSLSVFTRRLGTPLATAADPIRRHGWGYLDRPTEVLGESALRLETLDWFFDYHTHSTTRVANVMRRRPAATPAGRSDDMTG
jgi:anaerobic magnesium-protoporphyrin IX monomethyl ester cyclase